MASAPMTDRQLADIISDIIAVPPSGEYAAFDRELRERAAAISELEIVHILSLLRASFAWRSKLSNWGTFLEAARVELRRRGRDADRLLRGLAPVPRPSGEQEEVG